MPNSSGKYEELFLPILAAIEAIGTKGASPGTAAMAQGRAIQQGRESVAARQAAERDAAERARKAAMEEKIYGYKFDELESGKSQRQAQQLREQKLAEKAGLYEQEYSAASPEQRRDINLKYIDLPTAKARLDYEQKESKGDEWYQKLIAGAAIADQRDTRKAEAKKIEAISETVDNNYQNIPQYDDLISLTEAAKNSKTTLSGLSGKTFLAGKAAAELTGSPEGIMYINNIERIKQMLTLENRSKLKGQGQVSNYESQMIEKASTMIDSGSAEQRKQELNRINSLTKALRHRAQNRIIFKNGSWQKYTDGALIPVTPDEAMDLSIADKEKDPWEE